MNHKLLQRSVLWLAILACGLGLLVSKSPIPGSATLKSSSVVVASSPSAPSGTGSVAVPAVPGNAPVDDYSPPVQALGTDDVRQAPIEEVGR